MNRAVVMDAPAIQRALVRMAHEIAEANPNAEELALVGIRTNGVPLAKRLARYLAELLHRDVPIGEIDTSMHRDDWGLRHEVRRVGASHLPYDVTGRTIVLVDDVLFTGRSIRAAMDELMDFGRPRRIQLAVLVDRGHRELPIRPDFVGKNIPTSLTERVTVTLQELGGRDEVVVERDQ